MSPTLQSILTQKDDAKIELKSVSLHKGRNRLVVRFCSDRLLRVTRIAEIERELSSLLPEVTVEAEFEFPEAMKELCRDFDSCSCVLKETFCANNPALKPLIQNSRLRFDGHTLHLDAPAAAVDKVFSGHLIQDLRGCISSCYGLDLDVDVHSCEDILLPECGDIAETPVPLKVSAPSAHKNTAKSAAPQIAQSDILLGRAIKKTDIIKMCDVKEDSGRITVSGEVFAFESRQTKGGAGKTIVTFSITDYTNTLPVKQFFENTQAEKFLAKLEEVKKSGDHLSVRGDCYLDNYSHEICIQPLDINRVKPEVRKDIAEIGKRVELHLHTQMSTMDALTRVADVMKTAARWGHKAIAVTDHGVVQAFPDATKAAKKAGIKLIYGVEGYLIPDTDLRPIDELKYTALVVRTIVGGAGHTYISEIGAIRLSDGASFHTLVNPGVPFTPENGCSSEDYRTAPVVQDVLKSFLPFIEGQTLLVHDAEEAAALYDAAAMFGCEIEIAYINTQVLSQYLLRENKDRSINGVLRHLELPEVTGLLASHFAEGIASSFTSLDKLLRENRIDTVPVYFKHPHQKQKGHGHGANHIIILAKTQDGLKNLYKLVSYAHLDYFKGVPRIPRSLLSIHREGLILGSACEAGELFRAMVAGESEEQLLKIASWYDYLEIQPIGNNEFMVRDGTAKDDEALRDYNRRIVEMGEKLGKPVAATGDVHFLDPKDARYRAILMNYKGFPDADMQAPLYFKTTDEMLEEFSYLGEEKAREVVIDVPNAIADMCDELKPYPDGTHAPKFENAENDLKNMTLKRAHEVYGDVLPDIVQKRLDKELNSIITNGFASLYLMAQRLVQKSLGDGYLVGSRGSVGSSLVATMAGITEVNALAPHYVCPNCKHSDFDVDRSKYACGVDMPDANCPVCGTKYRKDGYEIPFEVFLGFHGDKTPDIDLNFSGEYQPVAHQYCEVMFGEGHAFRAGTISGLQDKTVYGYVRLYCDQKGLSVTRSEMDRLVSGCCGVKRTTGQHPGGIVVVPKDREITDFTPVQRPADKEDANTITTHFDFHALDDRLVKLDILGHDDPTALKMLEDITGLNPRSIPLDDAETMKIYSSSEPLGISLEELGCDVGSLGIPEFGTNFVRGMLKDTRPTTMEELVRIAGLSHGTDVWLNNAQLLVQSGDATLSEVICTRDDIMNYLIAHGGEPSISFKTMESVRKGRGLTEEMEAAMRAINIPEWFVDSCKKIKYMFPRAHAVAYVMMSFRIAYYKVHYPLAFYAVYYTVRADAFDVAKASGGAKKVLENIRAIEKMGKDASANDQSLLIILEVVYEMNLRGIELLPVDLYKSQATRFVIEGNAIRPPFSSVAGVGDNAAIAIAEECAKGPFLSVEEFQQRTRANSAVVTALREAGCFDGMAESNQVSLF